MMQRIGVEFVERLSPAQLRPSGESLGRPPQHVASHLRSRRPSFCPTWRQTQQSSWGRVFGAGQVDVRGPVGGVPLGDGDEVAVGVGGPTRRRIEPGLVRVAGADGFGHLVVDFGDTPFRSCTPSCFTLHRFPILNEFYGSGSLLPKPARYFLHQFPMHHAAPPRDDLRHCSSSPRPHQRHVRAAVVRGNFNVPSHLPADFTTPGGLAQGRDIG
jgi:hypothetical protein